MAFVEEGSSSWRFARKQRQCRFKMGCSSSSSGFVQHDAPQHSNHQTWEVLAQVSRSVQGVDVYKAQILHDWIEYGWKVLSQSSRLLRKRTGPSCASLPLIFADLAIISHLTIKMAPPKYASHLADRLATIVADNDDDLVKGYHLELSKSCERQSAGDKSDRDNNFDFQMEMQRIADELRWYFALHEDSEVDSAPAQ